MAPEPGPAWTMRAWWPLAIHCPRMTVECPDGLFDSLSGEIWDGDISEPPNLAQSIELLEEDDEDEDDDDDEDEDDEEE